MKKIICILLLLCIIICCPACNSTQNSNQDLTVFYYQRISPVFNRADGIIAKELRSLDKPDDLSILIQNYLLGPSDPDLQLLFPQNTVLRQISEKDDCLTIILSQECAGMTAVDLVVSCACLAKTVLPLTDAANISITAENGFKNITDPITFTAESILTEDFIQQLASS